MIIRAFWQRLDQPGPVANQRMIMAAGRHRPPPVSTSRTPHPVCEASGSGLEPERHAFHLIGTPPMSWSASRRRAALPRPADLPARTGAACRPRRANAMACSSSGDRVVLADAALDALGVGPGFGTTLIDVSTIRHPRRRATPPENGQPPPCRRRRHSGRRTHAGWRRRDPLGAALS